MKAITGVLGSIPTTLDRLTVEVQGQQYNPQEFTQELQRIRSANHTAAW